MYKGLCVGMLLSYHTHAYFDMAVSFERSLITLVSPKYTCYTSTSVDTTRNSIGTSSFPKSCEQPFRNKKLTCRRHPKGSFTRQRAVSALWPGWITALICRWVFYPSPAQSDTVTL